MLDELLQELIEKAIKEERGTKKVALAIISDDLRKEYLAWKDQKEDLEAEIEFRLERLRKKAEQQILEEFGPKVDKAHIQKEIIWDRIREEIGFHDKSTNLNIDPKTGLISKWVK